MLNIKNKIFTAPMAGVGDPIFRRMCKEGDSGLSDDSSGISGADICVSEMISADALFYDSEKTKQMMKLHPWDRPGGVQIFGSDPEKLARAAKQISEEINPEFIDINCGCPVNKVVSKNGGSALLKDSKLFSQITESVVKASSVAVFVKIRCGWDKNSYIEKEYGHIAQENGVSAIALHARTRAMFYTGEAMWERIKILKDSVKIPVIGNGDITSAEDAAKIYRETGCDAIMIGRASFGNPFIFSQIKQYLQGLAVKTVTTEDRISALKKHLQYFEEFYGENAPLGEMKKHIGWYIKGFEGSSAIRGKIMLCNNIAQAKEFFKKFF